MFLHRQDPIVPECPRARHTARWWVGAACMASAVGLVATTAPADAVTRTVQVRISYQINDYETIGSDEICTPTTRRVENLDDEHYFHRTSRARCGGEIRVEVKYTLDQENGTVFLTAGRVNFYEGDTDSTNDLDGTARIRKLTIPAGRAVDTTVNVSNTAENEPRDRARVSITVDNR